MSSVVHYHHPVDERFSLDFVNTDWSVIDDRLAAYETGVETKTETYELDETVHVVYTHSGASGGVETVEFDFEDAFESMTPPERVIAREYLELFRATVVSVESTEEETLQAYKDIDLLDFRDALRRIDWNETVIDTGASLLSNVVLAHALPNANHRTAFGLVQLYFRVSSSEFDVVSLTSDREWESWVADYVLDSKRLLTVRRNTDRFRLLADAGCETVVRKGGVEITLSEYDLTPRYHEALKTYADQHRKRTIEFADAVWARGGGSESSGSLDLATFAERLRETPD